MVVANIVKAVYLQPPDGVVVSSGLISQQHRCWQSYNGIHYFISLSFNSICQHSIVNGMIYTIAAVLLSQSFNSKVHSTSYNNRDIVNTMLLEYRRLVTRPLDVIVNVAMLQQNRHFHNQQSF